MPHLARFARVLLIALASFAANCSAEHAQLEVEKQDMAREVTAGYYSCVETAFASQLPTMVDRNAAIDQAFMVCKPEEAKLQALEESRSENPKASNAAIAHHRNKLKEELSRR
jgi:hypothetical protein